MRNDNERVLSNLKPSISTFHVHSKRSPGNIQNAPPCLVHNMARHQRRSLADNGGHSINGTKGDQSALQFCVTKTSNILKMGLLKTHQDARTVYR
jgi:hypothetical protein